MGLIDAGVQLFNNWMTNRRSRKDNEANRNFQMKMADQKWSRDLEMWQMNNQYNSPEKQMERFKDAGLNPNLVYGQGNNGNSSSMPQYQAPNYQQKTEAMKLPEFFNMFYDLKQKKQSIDLMERDEELKQQDRINKILQGGQLIESTKQIENKNKLFDALFPYQTQYKEMQIGEKRAKIEGVNADIKNKGKQGRILDARGSTAESEADIKKREAQLFRDYNVKPNDPIWLRAIMLLMNPTGGLEGVMKQIGDGLSKPIGTGSVIPYK